MKFREWLTSARLSDYLALGGFGGAVLTGVVGLAVSVTTVTNGPSSDKSPTLVQLEALASEMEARASTLERLAKQLPVTGDANSNAQILLLRAEVRSVADRQKRIEDAIPRDPARALELPLIREDLDNLRDAQSSSSQAVRQEVDRLYDVIKWLIGGGVSSLVAIALSLLISRVDAKRKELP